MSYKWERREAKKRKKRFGMRVSGKSVFVIKDQVDARARRAKKEQDYWLYLEKESNEQ